MTGSKSQKAGKPPFRMQVWCRKPMGRPLQYALPLQHQKAITKLRK